MKTSFARTLRSVVLPITIGFFWLNPAMCSSTESDYSGCSRSEPVYDTLPPSVPTGLTAVATSPATVEVTWDPSFDYGGGVIAYELRRVVPGGESRWTTQTATTDAQLTPSTEYCYRVRAVDRFHNASNYGPKVCATTLDPAAATVVATSLGVRPDQTVQIAYAVTPMMSGDRVVSYVTTSLARVRSTTHSAHALAGGPLAIYPEDAVLAVPSPTTGSVLRLLVPDLAGTWLGTASNAAIADGHHAGVTWSGDELHVAFYEAESRSLAYARWDRDFVHLGSWTVDAVGDVGRYPAIALAPDGEVHIAYFDATRNVVKHAWGTHGSWVTETLPLGRPIGPDVSLGVGPKGEVHVGAYDASSCAVLHATNTSGAWVVAIIDGRASGAAALGVDASGYVHVSYASDDHRTVRYATNAAGSWITVRVHP